MELHFEAVYNQVDQDFSVSVKNVKYRCKDYFIMLLILALARLNLASSFWLCRTQGMLYANLRHLLAFGCPPFYKEKHPRRRSRTNYLHSSSRKHLT